MHGNHVDALLALAFRLVELSQAEAAQARLQDAIVTMANKARDTGQSSVSQFTIAFVPKDRELMVLEFMLTAYNPGLAVWWGIRVYYPDVSDAAVISDEVLEWSDGGHVETANLGKLASQQVVNALTIIHNNGRTWFKKKSRKSPADGRPRA